MPDLVTTREYKKLLQQPRHRAHLRERPLLESGAGEQGVREGGL